MSFLLETIRKRAVDCLVKVAVSKGINCVQLKGLEIIGRYYSYKSSEGAGRKRYSVGILIVSWLQISSDTYARFEFNKISMYIEFISKDPY